MATNWYKAKGMNKYLKETYNPNYAKHKIKLPFRAVIVGSSGSGKTNTLLSLIALMNETFTKIVIVTKNKDEPLYNYLRDKTGGDKGMVKILEFDKEGIPDINKEFTPENNSLLVFDDLVNQTEKEQRPIADAFIRARKRGCSLVYISQSFYGVPKLIRNNLTHIFLKQVSSMKNLVMIARECALDIPKERLIQMYREATKDRMNFIMFDLDAPDEEKFRNGFALEYFSV
jgi:ABC-type dipeptide/oligopeptide/nickel transport system ATPase component